MLNLPCAFCTTPLGWTGTWANPPASDHTALKSSPRLRGAFLLHGQPVYARMRVYG